MNRTCSAHMADVKGKGICYEDDDGPIQLTDQGDSPLIRDYRLSLIGKILNPKKQTVVKLLQTMPAQWKMQDRITANDLGNGNFLLNFSNEEDLQSVLRQGPFHYNFCIFVLVRWEPVVHDDYPWVIPFWVEITGIPLHLWAIRNLEDIGRRLGHIDTVELTVGRMLIDVDTRKPLTFTRKIASPEGEEVSIQIHYEKLFEHCSTCRMLTHETAYCPSKITDSTSQNGRTGVFARVQLPDADDSRQPSLRNGNPLTLYDRYDGKSRSRNSSPSRKRGNEGGFMSDARRAHHSDTYHDRYGRSRDEFEKRREPTQRGLAGVARKHVSSRHNSRYAPYVKKQTQSWRVKASKSDCNTKYRVDQDVNVTKRRRDVTRVLSFSPKEDVLPMDAQIIGALNDMEIIGTKDDLLGEELMDMETGGNKETGAIHKETNEVTEMEMVSSSRKGGHSVSSSDKGGRWLGIPLGLPNSKAEFLRRGYPKLRSSKSRETHRSGKQHKSSTSKASEILTKPLRRSKTFKFDKRWIENEVLRQIILEG
ncbi:hypothetical protein Bca52824_026491 [Brassica carinata]|uniref:DUF4283 domain-containing protein n=1 Tax=Brassica carinata TaxID=52824 RepID=A0A8X7SGL4_BRACI|nr:hypothetical protein Bca52824_026491 [Brassica carinata]